MEGKKTMPEMEMEELKIELARLDGKIFRFEEILGSIRLDHGADLLPKEDSVLDAMWDEREKIFAEIQKRGEWLDF